MSSVAHLPRRKPCLACDGTGTVPDVYDRPRPCSRCNAEAFNRWSAARRPQASTPTEPPPGPPPPKDVA